MIKICTCEGLEICDGCYQAMLEDSDNELDNEERDSDDQQDDNGDEPNDHLLERQELEDFEQADEWFGASAEETF